MSIVDSIRNRPLLFGGTLVGGIVLLILLRASGSGGQMQASVPYGSDVGLGDALQSMQLQVNRDIAIAGIQASAASDASAAALEAAKLDYEYKNNAAAIGANVSLAQINATLQALTTRDTLEANVAINAEDEATARATIAANATTAQMTTVANALIEQSQASASVARAAIEAQKKQCGLFGKIFGC